MIASLLLYYALSIHTLSRKKSNESEMIQTYTDDSCQGKKWLQTSISLIA